MADTICCFACAEKRPVHPLSSRGNICVDCYKAPVVNIDDLRAARQVIDRDEPAWIWELRVRHDLEAAGIPMRPLGEAWSAELLVDPRDPYWEIWEGAAEADDDERLERIIDELGSGDGVVVAFLQAVSVGHTTASACRVSGLSRPRADKWMAALRHSLAA